MTTEWIDRLCRDLGLDRDAVDRICEPLGDTVSPREAVDALVEAGVAAETACLRVLAETYHLPYLDTIDSEHIDPTLVEDLPVGWARSQGVLPMVYEGTTAVAVFDPLAQAPVQHLRLLLGREVEAVLAPRDAIRRATEKAYYEKQTGDAEPWTEPGDPRETTSRPAGRSDLLEEEPSAPVTAWVNRMLLDAFKRGASDIHIEPFEHRLAVRFRIDGVLYDQAAPPKAMERSLVSRLKIMGRLDIAETRLPQDGMARAQVGDQEFDIRVSTLPVAEGERLVLRLLRKADTLLALSRLGMPDGILSDVRDLLREPQGIVLVTGPTGSGKTTTLYAGIRELDTQRTNVMTIEDPIEYQLPGISQTQVKPRIGLTFAQGLRHILRQDPDYVLVGEMRDLETAEIAIRASLTGHLVFSTLHTNRASDAAIRMADMGVEPYLVSTALRAVLSQRLVRRLCPECRERKAPPEEWLRVLPEAAREGLGDEWWTPVGCAACLEGYRGRVGLFELLACSREIRERIRAHDSAEAVERAAQAAGMRGLSEDALDKAADGITDIGEVLRVIGAQAFERYGEL